MSEEVLYSNVRFIKANKETRERGFPLAGLTFSEVKISKTQPPTTELPEGSQQPELSRKSKLTSERVALLVLSALLAAAVIALCVTTFQLERPKNNCECKKENLTDDPCYKCEEGWQKHGRKCYYFSITKSSWNESKAECRAKKGDLAKIESVDVQKFLEKRLKDTNNHENKFWIGLMYSAENGRWLWMDRSPLDKSLTFWNRSEPDTRDRTNRGNPDGQNCVKLGAKDGPYDLKLTSCKKAQRICEKPAVT